MTRRNTIIQADTFDYVERASKIDGTMQDKGTVEATVEGKTQRVEAVRVWERNGTVTVYSYGFLAKYRTGAKLWGACVTWRKCANGIVSERVDFGRDNRQTWKTFGGLFFK